jgi:hypothetical protein
VALVEWHTAEGPHIGTNGLVNVMALSPVPVAGGSEIAIDDEVPSDPDERYVYRLRLRDPRGRTAESVPVQEAP